MRRVLLLSPSAQAAGSERVHAALVRRLPEFGFEPIPVLLERGPLEDWLAGACPTVLEAGRVRQLGRTIATVGAIRRLMCKSEAAVVLSNEPKGHVYGGTAAATAGVPAVWWQQAPVGSGALDRVAAAIPAAAVVCSSDAIRRRRAELFPHPRLEVVHLGVPISAVRRSRGRGKAIRQRLGWIENPVVGIVGRLDPWKGQGTFLEAADIVAQECPTVRFAVIGGASSEAERTHAAELLALAASPGLAGRIHFTGHVDEPYAWMDMLDVVVHASRDEPFGLVVVEAMALGKAIVCAAEGGPVEIVGGHECALAVPPRDARAIAGAVRRLLVEPELADRLSRQASSRADVFSEERMVERTASILERVVERGAG